MRREEVSEMVQSLWRQTLDRAVEIHGTSNFFELGGHSMHGARLMSLLSKELGAELPMRLIFEDPVFDSFVDRTHQALAQADAMVAQEPPRGGHMSAPASLQQRQLLAIEEVLGPSPANNVVLVAEVARPLRVDLLRAGLRILLARHPALRLAFRPGDPAQEQVVRPLASADVDLEVVKVGPMPDEAGLAQAVRRAVRLAHLRPFDLEAGCLLRAQLVLPEGLNPLLVLHLHHLAVDGASQEVLLEDLVAAYAALAEGEPPPEPEDGSLTYPDYAAWQSGRWRGLLAESAAHWRDVVHVLATDLTRVGLRQPPPGIRFTRSSAEVPAEIFAAVRQWAGAVGGTEFIAVAAAAAAALHSVSGQNWVGLGVLLENRSRPELQRTVGPFATSSLLAVEAGATATPLQLLGRVKAQLLEALRWADLPLELMLTEPARDVQMGPNELIDLVVTLERPYRLSAAVLPMSVVLGHGELIMPAVPATRRNLVVTLDDGAGLSLTVEHADDAAEREHAGRLLAALQDAFLRFGRGPDIPVSEQSRPGSLTGTGRPEGW